MVSTCVSGSCATTCNTLTPVNRATVCGRSDRIHFEYFAGQKIDTAADQPFEVKLASSGKVVTVPATKSAVAALRDAGIEIEVSCEQGICGTCLTRVLDGEPDHRDKFLSDEEKAANDQFLPCCSRAKSRLLVLDL